MDELISVMEDIRDILSSIDTKLDTLVLRHTKSKMTRKKPKIKTRLKGAL